MFCNRLAAVLSSIALVVVIFAPIATRAQTSTDEMQVISLTASTVVKSLGPGVSVHVTKLALNSSYALAEWTAGGRSGQEILEKRLGM